METLLEVKGCLENIMTIALQRNKLLKELVWLSPMAAMEMVLLMGVD